MTTLLVFSQEWKIPENRVKKVSPLKFDSNLTNQGNSIYQRNCKSCHGDPGKENFIQLDPRPSDLASDIAQKQSDGSLFFKISGGRRAMPSFKDVLSENDRWSVIAYIRSFNENYKQPALELAGKAFDGSGMLLSLGYNSIANKISAELKGIKDGDTISVEGVAIKLMAKRYFGKLQIGEEEKTAKTGIAEFYIVNEIPGDKDGNIEFVVKVSDTEKYGELQQVALFPLGIPTDKPGLTEERAMWNISSKVPWWLYVTYPVGLLTVLGTLVWIGFQMYRIYKLGGENRVIKNFKTKTTD